MYKNRKKGLVLFMTIFLLTGMLGCGGKIISDAGTDISNKGDIDKYLDTQAITEEKPKTTYHTHVIKYGTFEKPAVQSMIDWAPYSTRQVKAKVEEGTMTYVGSGVLGNYTYVQKGDVIATVEMEVDLTDITEAKLRLQRLQERYARDCEEFLEQRKKDIEENDRIPDKYIYESGRILLERKVLEWENKARNYELQISEAARRVEKLERLANTTTITAPADGIIYQTENVPKSGDEIKDGQIIINLIPVDEYMVGLRNESEIYAYGMEFTFQILQPKNSSEVVEIQGKVINGTQGDLYGNLDNSMIYFKMDIEENGNIYTSSARISGNVYTMENVLLVPKDAVTQEDDIAYVTVVNPDGSFIKTGFKAGGANSEYYWVLSGLEEGTEVLLGK